MNAPFIESISLTWSQWKLLEQAETGPARVVGPALTAAKKLVEKGLGTLGETTGVQIFDINAAGRDQLRIRR